MNCVNCKNEIPDSTEKCPRCGWDQKKTPKLGVEIRECRHCKGTGTCKNAKTFEFEHSCEPCIKEAGGSANLFPVVLCSVCKGKGYTVVDLKMKEEKDKKEQKNKGRRR